MHAPNIRRLLLPAVVTAGIIAATAAAEPRGGGPRLYALDCGTIEVLDISFFSPGVDVGVARTLTNGCFLVVHPGGTLIWDAGLPDELASVSEPDTLLGTFVMHVARPLASQLEEIGHPAATVDFLALSHLHFDHVGNVGLFPDATLLVQREEYEAAFGPDPASYNFDLSTYASLRGNPVEKLDGEHDVFGDGTVVIRPAPGHTPGHQALYVELPETGGVLLSGDLVHFADNWVHRRVPSSNHDRAASLRTMEATRDFLKKTDATLWIQHDPEQWAALRHAPDYYE